MVETARFVDEGRRNASINPKEPHRDGAAHPKRLARCCRGAAVAVPGVGVLLFAFSLLGAGSSTWQQLDAPWRECGSCLSAAQCLSVCGCSWIERNGTRGRCAESAGMREDDDKGDKREDAQCSLAIALSFWGASALGACCIVAPCACVWMSWARRQRRRAEGWPAARERLVFCITPPTVPVLEV